MTSLHPAILLCWLVLAVCVLVVGYLIIALCLEWWERRQDARTYQTRTRHCPECQGTGVDPHAQPPIDLGDGRRMYMPCQVCAPCDECRGTGDEMVDSMTLYGIPGGDDVGGPCPKCGGTGRTYQTRTRHHRQVER